MKLKGDYQDRAANLADPIFSDGERAGYEWNFVLPYPEPPSNFDMEARAVWRNGFRGGREERQRRIEIDASKARRGEVRNRHGMRSLVDELLRQEQRDLDLESRGVRAYLEA